MRRGLWTTVQPTTRSQPRHFGNAFWELSGCPSLLSLSLCAGHMKTKLTNPSARRSRGSGFSWRSWRSLRNINKQLFKAVIVDELKNVMMAWCMRKGLTDFPGSPVSPLDPGRPSTPWGGKDSNGKTTSLAPDNRAADVYGNMKPEGGPSFPSISTWDTSNITQQVVLIWEV